MWSLPHTESNPSSSHKSAAGRMSEGFAKGTGYIMPSMHVGMWTPNLMSRAQDISETRLQRGQQLGRDESELLDRVGLAGGQGDGGVEARIEPGREPTAPGAGGAGDRDGR